jgi:hypothetical protein
MSRTPPPAYSRALDALAGAVRDAHALAELLEYAAALLRGKPPAPDGPLLDLVPGGRVLAGLGRRDWAQADAEPARRGFSHRGNCGKRPVFGIRPVAPCGERLFSCHGQATQVTYTPVVADVPRPWLFFL